MDYYRVDESLQAVLNQYLPLSRVQTNRIKQVSLGVYLAGNSHLRAIARWLKKPIQQDSRIEWLQRLLATPYLEQEYAYQPLIKQALSDYQAQTLHVVMDRTDLWQQQTDLLSLNLSFRKRAVPLGWQCLPHGRTDSQSQIALLKRCIAVLPPEKQVIFHGDGEFGSVALMRFVQQQGWNFIVGQSRSTHYWRWSDLRSRPLKSLAVTPTQAVYLTDIRLTQTHQFGPLNLFAFYRPHYSNRKRKREIAYCATSLPSCPATRRVGRHRWHIEPFYRDYKSAGWQLQQSFLAHPQRRKGFLSILALNYLWATCLGRWLCKTSQRKFIDNDPVRRLSLFQIGWDWLVYSYNMQRPCPALLTLYQ